MTEHEARELLGLGPDDDFASARPQLEVQLEALSDASAVEQDPYHKAAMANQLSRANEAHALLIGLQEGADRRSKKGGWLVWATVGLFIATALVWGLVWQTNEREKRQRQLDEQAAIRQEIDTAVETRKWLRADELATRYEEAGASMELQAEVSEAIASGKYAEQRQRLAFLDGELRRLAEEGAWERAEERLAEISLLEPDYEDRAELRQLITDGRNSQRRIVLEQKIRRSISSADWREATLRISELDSVPGAIEVAATLRAELAAARAELLRKKAESRRLTEVARALDVGVYNVEALESLQQALALDPQNAEAQKLFDRFSAYGRTLRVPEDYKTIADAMQEARARDTLVIGEGTYSGTITLLPGMTLVGAGFDKTIIECEPEAGSAIAFAGGNADSASVSALQVRHRGFSYGYERYALITVTGGELRLTSIKAIGAAGHGLAVEAGGRVQAVSSRFSRSGWDGVAAHGTGSQVRLQDCAIASNLGAGVKCWDGARLDIRDSRIERNIEAGLALGSSPQPHELRDIRSVANRAAGVMIYGGGQAAISEARLQQNMRGGLVVLGESSATISKCDVKKNVWAGVIVERGSSIEQKSSNEIANNGLRSRDNLRKDVDFATTAGE